MTELELSLSKAECNKGSITFKLFWGKVFKIIDNGRGCAYRARSLKGKQRCRLLRDYSDFVSKVGKKWANVEPKVKLYMASVKAS